MLRDTTKKRDNLKAMIEEIEAKNKLNNSNLNKKQNELKDLEIKVSKMDVKLDYYLNTLSEDYELTFEKAKEKYQLEIEVEEARVKVNTYKNNIKKIGMVNLASIEEYDKVYDIDLSTIRSTVAFPHLPENTHTVDSIDDIKIDQVVIGSCTNGRIDDLRCAAKILEGRKVAKGLRVIVIPATQKIYMQAIEEGLVQTFIKAGAVVSTPTCGPCLGGYMGILAEGERCVSTTNRNFVGRMGHVDSEIYLASPAVAAASAVTGKISQPSELGL